MHDRLPKARPAPGESLTCFINANSKYTQDVGRIKFLHGFDLITESMPHYSMKIKGEIRISGLEGASENPCTSRVRVGA